MADQQTVQQPQSLSTDASVQTPTVDYEKQFKELDGKYKDLESKYTEEVETSKTMDTYFTQDEVAKQRAALWLQSQKEGKPFQELLKTLESPPAKQKENEAPVFDEKKIKQLVEQELQSHNAPIQERIAELDREKSKADLFKSEQWLTEEKYKEFETKFGKKIDEIASKKFASMGPFLTQMERQKAAKDSYSYAYSKYEDLSEPELLRVFMAEDRDKFITEGRRPAPRIPGEMTGNLPTGKAPELLKQLKQKYGALEGNHADVGKLCQEFAPQLGMSPEEVYKLLD